MDPKDASEPSRHNVEGVTGRTPRALPPDVSAVAVLTLVVLFTLAAHRRVGRAPTPPLTVYHLALDPNKAPWWELTVLPRVGESLAKRIVAFRDSATASEAQTDSNHAVFRDADDLARVHGIGPKTVARLRPHLHFD